MCGPYSGRYIGLPVTDDEDTGQEPLQSTDINVNILESESPQVHSLTTPDYMPFSVVLDSGAADHVVSNAETPGYEITESAGSKAGACFVAANGERIPNRGQMKLELKSGTVLIKFVFQVSKIS